MECEHLFEAKAEINILTDFGTFAVDLKVKCVHCRKDLLFFGLPGGLDPWKPTCSFDQKEARLPAILGD